MSHYLDIVVDEKSLVRDASFEQFDELPAATAFEVITARCWISTILTYPYQSYKIFLNRS